MEQGFVRGQSDNLPKVDLSMIFTYLSENPLYTSKEIRGVKLSNMASVLTGLRRGAALRQLVRTMAEARSADEMALTFAAGNKVFYDKVVVKQVDVPSFSGAFGILPKHVPTLAVLRPGVVTVTENDGKQNKIFVSSGTITVNDDSSVQVLAEEAHPLENLDRAAAQEALNKAQSELSSASNDKAKAEAAIAVEVAEEIVKAAS